MIKIKQLFVAGLLFISSLVRADEGMWLPLLLGKMNEAQMKSLGMKISAKDIYSINSGSLKDAIVSFGGFCTGDVISSKGLVLTNHHCGFDAIQNHSTLDRNYIRDGFWAKNNAEEIPNPGLFVTFIVRIEDVSALALKGVTASMSESERQSAIDKNIAALRKELKKESYQDSFVRGFFEGNQYYLFVTERYNDIRLVGAPPSSIGNFGKDTDNWMWPRHTGDFSMFRIYAGKDNKPAEYSADNIPYTPKRSLAISMDGVAANDFTMVFGFPGKTNQYLHSAAVNQVMTLNDPAKITIRDKALGVIDGFMRKDEQIKIQYASKYAGISNAWKKWQGEVLGLTITNALGKKKAYEAEFQKRVDASPVLSSKYKNLLGDLETAYGQISPFGVARDYYLEIMSKIELFTVYNWIGSLRKFENDPKGYEQRLIQVKDMLDGFYKEYNAAVDQQLFQALIPLYIQDQDVKFQSTALRTSLSEYKDDYAAMSAAFFGNTMFDEPEAVNALLNKSSSEVITALNKDISAKLYSELVTTYSGSVAKNLNEVQDRINLLNRTYMAAQMEVFKEKKFYPDANSTLRVTYGKVNGYNPRDAVKYDHYTYLDGVMDKYVPGDYEFDLPQKLRDLYKAKDYGQYGKNGKMPVCFIATNHTTGGNSGSPALDANGNLVGLNFDRVWEGTMSDINYDASICRNIMVDIRYVLFIVDKYAGAGHLVKEMKLVRKRS